MRGPRSTPGRGWGIVGLSLFPGVTDPAVAEEDSRDNACPVLMFGSDGQRGDGKLPLTSQLRVRLILWWHDHLGRYRPWGGRPCPGKMSHRQIKTLLDNLGN